MIKEKCFSTEWLESFKDVIPCLTAGRELPLQNAGLTPINYYKGEDIKPLVIEEQHWNFLNRLKRQPDKSSFYYWYHTVQLYHINFEMS